MRMDLLVRVAIAMGCILAAACSEDALPTPGDCVTTSTSSLAGVHVVLSKARCRFTLAEIAQGYEFGYEVVVDADVADVKPTSSVGRCSPPHASGLYTFGQITGNNQRYCICDEGLCPPPAPDPITLRAGRYPGTFAWDGRNWFGPSDTGNPKGPPFPAGTYTLDMSAIGERAGTPFDVRGTLAIQLLP